MGKFEKLFDEIVRKRNAEIRYDDLCYFVEHLGFDGRQNGTSHCVYTMNGVEEIINLQEKNGMAKPYQVRQVAKIVRKYKMGGKDDE